MIIVIDEAYGHAIGPNELDGLCDADVVTCLAPYEGNVRRFYVLLDSEQSPA